jgi:predicted Zn finger-like uncharacterized protein
MKVKCEKCKSEFILNENLLKKEGSTVRCSLCKSVFKVFPPEPAIFEGPIEEDFSDTAMEETVALDMPPDLEGIEEEPIEEDSRDSFDKAFEEAMEEVVEDEDLVVPDDEFMPVREDTAELITKKAEPAAVKIGGVQKKEKRRPKILLISLSIVLFLIIVFLVVFFFFPGLLPESLYSKQSANVETAVDAGVNKLDFEGVAGSFSKSDKAGKLYIIEGSVINNDQKTRSFIRLKGSLLNEQGSPIKQELAYAGNVFTDEELNGMSIDDISKTLTNKTGRDNINVDIKPGASVPFMIVFTDLPDGMSEFTLEAVSSSYGK